MQIPTNVSSSSVIQSISLNYQALSQTMEEAHRKATLNYPVIDPTLRNKIIQSNHLLKSIQKAQSGEHINLLQIASSLRQIMPSEIYPLQYISTIGVLNEIQLRVLDSLEIYTS